MACRDIAMASYVHLDKVHYGKIGSLLMMFVISLKQHLQGEFLVSELQPFIETSGLNPKILMKYRNQPIFILRNISSLITSLVVEKYQKVEVYEKLFGSSLHILSNTIASCERLVKQPIPLSYTRHTSRFLSFYLFTLPFALLSLLNWTTIPVMILLSWSFVSIQEIGLFIENPFDKEKQIIPLNQLISAIRIDIDEIFDGILGVGNVELMNFDAKMLQSMKERSRPQDDTYFLYYQHDDTK